MLKNKRFLWAVTGSCMGWFAVLTQYYLMRNNPHTVLSGTEITIRFFSFFTILTNSLVSIYFTARVFKPQTDPHALLSKHGIMTAITVYITIVGLVYQIALRPLWNPQGLQMVVDELLHSIIPLYVILYWYFYENKSALQWKQTIGWMIYPTLYLVFLLVRGRVSDFYPYPFMDVNTLGLYKVLSNSVVLMLFFIGISLFYIGVGKKTG